jgi:hypothetical protein
MSLPVVGTTPGGSTGTSWGPQLTQSLLQVDAHDHSPGKGALLSFTSASFVPTTDLGFNNHSLFGINNITASGSVSANALTGSHTQISGGLAAFIGIAGITITTNSLGQVLVSSSIGDDRFASYILVSLDAENPNARFITGSGGTSITDGGVGGPLTLSSSAPVVQNIVGLGGVSTSHTGQTWFVSSSLVTVSGTGGSAVSSGGGTTYVVSSSLVTVSGSGATSVSNGGGSSYVVSSSTPAATQVQFVPLTASNWNPSPTTVAQALVALASPNFTATLAPTQNNLVAVSVSGTISKNKSGVVSLAGTLVVNPSAAASGSAQLFRDSTQIGPTMSLLMAVQVPLAFSLDWIDTLPDTGPHTYSLQVSASLGTLSVSASAGSMLVRELN